jgi:hypothetical protein
MAVPQLQLANLGEIFAQNQAKQAAMDTMQLQQAEAVSARDARVKAVEREAKLREAIASGVDPSTPEGLGQLLRAGLPVDQYSSLLKNSAEIKLAEQKQKNTEQKAILEAANKPFNADGSPNPMYQAYAMASRQAGASRTTNIVSLPKVEESALVEGNKDFIKYAYRPTIQSGQAAQIGNALLDTTAKLLADSGSGWSKELQARAFKIASDFGLASNEARKIASSAEAFRSVLNQQVFTQLEGLNGVQTEGDAQRARDVFAQLGNTPEANQFIIDLGKAKNNFQIKKARFYAQEVPKVRKVGSGADLTRVEAKWLEESPSIWDDPVMKKYLPKAQPAPTNGGQGGVISFEEFMSQ